MQVRTTTISIATDASGDFVSDNIIPPGGIFLQARYIAGDLSATTSDLTITENETGFTLLSIANFNGTADFIKLPRRLICNAADGADSTTVFDYQAVEGKITVTIAQGGANATGTLVLYFS